MRTMTKTTDIRKESKLVAAKHNDEGIEIMIRRTEAKRNVSTRWHLFLADVYEASFSSPKDVYAAAENLGWK
jgi:hypothetical protein